MARSACSVGCAWSPGRTWSPVKSFFCTSSETDYIIIVILLFERSCCTQINNIIKLIHLWWSTLWHPRMMNIQIRSKDTIVPLVPGPFFTKVKSLMTDLIVTPHSHTPDVCFSKLWRFPNIVYLVIGNMSVASGNSMGRTTGCKAQLTYISGPWTLKV